MRGEREFQRFTAGVKKSAAACGACSDDQFGVEIVWGADGEAAGENHGSGFLASFEQFVTGTFERRQFGGGNGRARLTNFGNDASVINNFEIRTRFAKRGDGVRID